MVHYRRSALSTSISAAAAITLTEVPPFTVPTANGVFGFLGVCRSPILAVARRIAWIAPPVTQERLHLTDGGQVRLPLRQSWHDGTTDVVFDPVESLGRSAVLVPRLRINLIL